jgi:serine/threonine-protein kinase RsbW
MGGSSCRCFGGRLGSVFIGFDRLERGNLARIMPTFQRAELRLPHESSTVPLVRELARMVVGSRLGRERLEDLQLVLSEVVANAVLRGSPLDTGQIVVTIELDGAVVRGIVRDCGAGVAFGHPTEDQARPHLGLRLIDRLADNWGVSSNGEKAVWFEIDGVAAAWQRRTAEYVVDCRALASVN